jgi:hypothetical protein
VGDTGVGGFTGVDGIIVVDAGWQLEHDPEPS